MENETKMNNHTIIYSMDRNERKILAKNESGETVGYIAFTDDTNPWDILHTEVDPDYRGGDIARTLVLKMVTAAREAGVRLTSTCPYSKKVLTRTVEYHDVFTPEPEESL